MRREVDFKVRKVGERYVVVRVERVVDARRHSGSIRAVASRRSAAEAEHAMRALHAQEASASLHRAAA
jgi:hypothetical protein